MNKNIYISEFSDSPKSSKKEQMLLAADVAYAASEGFKFIQTNTGKVFQIVEDNELMEVDLTNIKNIEENMKVLLDDIEELLEAAEDEVKDYCIVCHNLQLIDEIINNTLSNKSDITLQQADTMIKLTQLKIMMLQADNLMEGGY